MTNQKFRSILGWATLAALVLGFAAGWPTLAAIGVVMAAAWLFGQPYAWFWLFFWSR